MLKKLVNKILGGAINAQATQIAEQQVDAALDQLEASAYFAGWSAYGSYGGTSDGSKWDAGISSSGYVQHFNHYLLRRNARKAYYDTPQAKALVDRYADTVADVGLVLEATPKAAVLGITEEAAERWANDVEQKFDSWASSKKQHRSETMNWYQSHRLYQIYQHRDNDIFTRFYYSSDRDLLSTLQFSGIDPDQIRGDSVTSTLGVPNGGDRHDGIKKDDRGREISYDVWIRDPKKKAGLKRVTIPAVGRKSKRRFMLHGFVPEYCNQSRGYSRLAHALQEFQNITDFTSAQIQKAINQSQIAAYVKPSKTDPASNPLEGILTDRGAGPAAQQFGSAAVAEDSTDSECVNPVECYRVPEATMATPGGMFITSLNKGEDLGTLNVTAPAESFDKFVDAFTGYLSASMGMPLEVLLMKFNANYSASRGALILFWRVVQIWRAEMAADYLNPTYEAWLSEEIAAGRVVAPGWSDPRLKQAWLTNSWIGSPMPNIDPKRTADADRTYLELGAQTLDRVARNLNGSSGASNRAKLTREYAGLPLPPWSPVTVVGTSGTSGTRGGDDD